MTRKEWMEEKAQLGWEFACLLEEEQDLRDRRKKLMERSDQLNAHEPDNEN